MKIRPLNLLYVLLFWGCLLLPPVLGDVPSPEEGAAQSPGEPTPGAATESVLTSSSEEEPPAEVIAGERTATKSAVAGNDSTLDVSGSPELQQIVEEIEKASGLVNELLAARREEVDAKTSSAAVAPALTEALRTWENATEKKAAARSELIALLEGVRMSVELDLLVVVTQSGDTFFAPVVERTESDRDSARETVARSFSEVRASSGTAIFTRTRSDGNVLGRHPFLVALRPISLRPDAPHSVLIGGMALASFAHQINSILDDSVADLDWHVFRTDDAGEPPLVLEGPRAGQTVSPAVAEMLAADGSLSGSVFTRDSPLGRWNQLLDCSGRLLGGWGVEVNQRFLDTLLASTTDTLPPGTTTAVELSAEAGEPVARSADEERDARRMKLFFVILTATGALGIVLVSAIVFINALRRRRLEKEIAYAEDVAEAPAPARSDPRDLAGQFEQNWKTFASYTQDLLEESLKQIEKAPHEDVRRIRDRVELAFEEIVQVRKEVARLHTEARDATSDASSEALVEIKNQLSIARDEVKNSSNGVVRRLTAALGELSPPKEFDGALEDLMRRVEVELLETKQGFGLVNETVLKLAEILSERQTLEVDRLIEAEVARTNAEWEARHGEYRRQVEHATQQMEPLLQELEEARQNERDLRADLEEAAARQTQIESELEEERAKGKLLTTEREDAWRRERKVVEDLQEAERRQRELGENADALAATIRELQEEIDEVRGREEELRGREEELREELEQSNQSENEAYDELKEREAEVEQLRQRFDEERRELLARVERLEAEETLGARTGDDPSESARLREQNDGLRKELGTLRSAFDALKAEKRHLLEESTRFGRQTTGTMGEGVAATQALRADLAAAPSELAASKEPLRVARETDRHSELVEELRETLTTRETELAQVRLELSNLRQRFELLDTTSDAPDVDQMRRSLVDTGKELRECVQERLSLTTQIRERDAEWQSRVNSLDLQVAETNRMLSETQSKLAKSDQVIRELETQLVAVQETSRPDPRTYERIQNLKREKQELVRSLEGLKSDLGNARKDSEKTRDLHEALFHGGIPTAIVACDRELKVFAWNTAAERLWARPRGSVQGTPLGDLALTPNREISALAKASLNSGKSEHIEELLWSGTEGDPRYLRVHCDPILNPREGVEGVVLCVEDITALVEQRLEARLQGLFAEALTESLPSALVVLDGRDRVTAWNQTAGKLFGVETARAIGKEFFALDTPLNKGVFRRRFLKAKEQHKVKKLRVRMDPDGAPGQYVVTQCPFKSKDDEPRGTVLLVETVA